MLNQHLYQLKEEFLEKWPLARIKRMSLEEYTNLNKDSFCYWIEAKTDTLGSVWGGSSYKFGIYKRKDLSKTITVDNRKTDNEYAWFVKYGATRNAAFEKVRSIIVSIIENVQANNLEAIDNLDLGDGYKWKIAFLYSNFSVISIYKFESLKNAAEYLGYTSNDFRYSQLSKFIISKKKAEEDYFEFTKRLWNEYINPSEVLQENAENNKFPLNQILYGPPGTGKTYHSVNHAVAIIENKPLTLIESEPRVEVFKRFETYQEKHLVRFVTFHQSFSYEDFVEGIKPKTIGEDNDQKVVYEIEDGVFKSIAIDAGSISKLANNPERNKLNLNEEILNRVNYYKTSLGNSKNAEDDIIYDYCKENNVIAVGWGDDIDFTETKSEQDVIDTFLQDKAYKSTDYAIVAIKCLKFWMQQNDIVFISNGNTRVRAIAQITGDYFFKADSEIRYNQFRPVKWLATDLDIPVELVYEKKFSMQTIYGMFSNQVKKEFFINNFKEEAKTAIQNYVLIIDEINRGNVSQIFGELITLLEADKRSGVEQGMPMKIMLPYSKKKFSVPSNLYIIGTMNTADRSVEALDTALRRRFSFEEMPPKYNLEQLNYSVAGETANHILATINKRIEKLLDKDHLIGHSFFIRNKSESEIEKMIDAFYKNIIPLLQEYFYGDYGKIGLILGKGFVDRKAWDKDNDTFAAFDYSNDFGEREVFEIIDHRADNPAFERAIQLLMNKKIA